MTLRESFEKSGNWLFSRRSYLPLILFAVLLLQLRGFHYPFGSRVLARCWEYACFFCSLCGLGLRFYTVGHVPEGTSGRNTRGQVADTLNTSGMYSIVRNPLYLGNLVIWLGLALFPRIWWFPILTVVVFWLYYERIMFAEEEFLRRRFADAFEQWAGAVPAFLPRFSLWRPAALRFSLKTALRREYNGLFSIVLSFFILVTASDFVATGSLRPDPVWIVILAAGIVMFLLLRTLKKKTRFLNVPGR